MTFDEYIQNPMGEKNAVISNRTMYRNYYQEKLDKIMVREQGKVDYKAYTAGKRYIVYIKIPSEVVPNFYYDVLVEFTPPGKQIVGFSLEKYNVRFYSNDPSFVYTFAHAFKRNGLFFTEFEDKMSERALKEKADEKNPKDIVGYVKSLYFAYLLMKKRGLFSTALYTNSYSSKAVHREVMDAEKKIAARQLAAQEMAENKRAEKRKQKEMTSKRNNQAPEIPIKGFTGKIKKTSSTKKVGMTKSKTIKTVKKK